MRATLLLSIVVLLAACGSPQERATCGTSPDCPAGQYCARTGDGNVCWPDAVAPVVSGVTVTCAAPCLRDSTLQVEATISDDTEVLDARVTLDVGGAAVPLSRAGSTWTAQLPLKEFPFDYFTHGVVATVTARDGARNESLPVAGSPVSATRLKWSFNVGAPVTAAAVKADGSAVMGVSANQGQLYAVSPEGEKDWSLTVGSTSFLSAAPAIGRDAIWAGSESNWVYAASLDGAYVVTGATVNTEGDVKGAIAVVTESNREWGLAASSSGRVCAASSVAPFDVGRTTAVGTYLAGPVIRGDGKVCTATATASATINCFTFDGALNPDWSANVGVIVAAPLVVDANDNVWTGSQDGRLNRTDPTGVTSTIATLVGAIVDSPVVLANGDVVVGDATGTLYRVSSTGSVLWSRRLNGNPGVDDPLLAPMVLSGSDAALIVPTKGGVLYARTPSGAPVWQGSLSSSAELRAANIHTPGGQTGSILSVAYVPDSDGWLHAVIVDGELDRAAPWPKAFHDPANTNRAGATW